MEFTDLQKGIFVLHAQRGIGQVQWPAMAQPGIEDLIGK